MLEQRYCKKINKQNPRILLTIFRLLYYYGYYNYNENITIFIPCTYRKTITQASS